MELALGPECGMLLRRSVDLCTTGLKLEFSSLQSQGAGFFQRFLYAVFLFFSVLACVLVE